MILDEPTNHLDITSKEILEDALKNYTGTVFFVSHDRYFINQTATRVLELTGETIINYIGNYDYYLEKREQLAQVYVKKQETASVETASTLSEQKMDWQAQKAEAARIRKLENDLKKTEKRIEELEELLEEIDEECAKPENAVNSAKLNELSAKRTACEEELESCMEDWEKLSVELEN